MADFSKTKKSLKGLNNGIKGAPIKGTQKRDRRLDLRASQSELDLIDELVKVLHERRNVGKTRMDMLMYLVEREYTKQDALRVISKV